MVTPVGTSVYAPFVGDRLAAPRRSQWARRAVVALALTLFAASSALAQTTRTVTAAWDANTDTLTRGYIVYYGTASGSYQWSHDAGMQTSTPLTLNVGSQYFFVVRAYDATSNLGPASNEATFDLRTAAPTATITATLSGTSAVVTWSTTNAVSATINGTAVALSGTTTVPVSATTTFTIVATNAAGATVTRSATVTVTAPSPTANLTATLQGGNTAVLTWSTTNATTATINGAAVALSGTASVPVSATTTFTLVARAANGTTATRSATVTVTPPPAPVPTAALTASLQNGTTAVLNWTTTNATSATINGTAVAVNGTVSVPVAATTTYTLVATGAGGSATSSATVTVTPPVSTVPNAPTNTTSTVSGTLVRIGWRAPASGPALTSYRLDVGTKSGTSNIVSGLNVGNVLAVSGNLPRGRYFVRVRAANAAGASAASPETNFWVGKRLLSPTGFNVRWVGSTAVFTWTQPVADAADVEAPSGYVLEAGTTPGEASISVPVGNVTSFSAPVPSGTYYVRVKGVGEGAESDPTQELILTPPGAPGAPTALTESGSAATVTLRWQAPASGGAVTAYQIEAGSAPGLSNLAVVQTGNIQSFSTPIPAGTYYVRVRALNGSGPGPVSNEVVVRR